MIIFYEFICLRIWCFDTNAKDNIYVWYCVHNGKREFLTSGMSLLNQSKHTSLPSVLTSRSRYWYPLRNTNDGSLEIIFHKNINYGISKYYYL